VLSEPEAYRFTVTHGIAVSIGFAIPNGISIADRFTVTHGIAVSIGQPVADNFAIAHRIYNAERGQPFRYND
jgi:3-dehydroquinate synthetase